MNLPNLTKKLNFNFKNKPLLVGGFAMEYYKIRKAGQDIDFIVDKRDHQKLKKHLEKKKLIRRKTGHKQSYKKIPELVDLSGDQGLLIFEFEIWDQILKYDYHFLSEHALEKKNCKIISLEKLLILKALAMNKPKYLRDTKLIIKKILENKYKS